MVRIRRVGWTEDGMSVYGVESEISGDRDEVFFFFLDRSDCAFVFISSKRFMNYLSCFNLAAGLLCVCDSVCLYWKPT